MAKTVYTMKVALEVDVDPTKPVTLTQAADWLSKVGEGEVITPPEGMKLTVVVVSEPDIVKRRED